jgi:hypothetical protein
VAVSDRGEHTASFFRADVNQHGKVADYAEVRGEKK